jgi:hypothetical protein
MLRKDCSAIGINLAEGDGSHSRSFKAETESADATEEIEDIHFTTLTVSTTRTGE